MNIMALTPYEKRRLRKAQQNIYDMPVNGFLFRFIPSVTGGSGIVFDHFPASNSDFRFDDGTHIFTSSVKYGRKEGFFRVIQTRNSRYVIVTVEKSGSLYLFKDFWENISTLVVKSPKEA
jgi:hypothetical protein